MQQSRRGGGTGPSQSVTFHSTLELVIQVSAHLHRIARRRRRDRWWFLGGEAPNEDEGLPAGWQWTYPPKTVDPKKDVVGSRILFQGSAPGLSCVIRALWNIRPDRRPHLFVDFLSPSKEKKRVTIEVAIGEQHRPSGIFTKRAVRGLSLANRQRLWQDYRRWFSTPNRRFAKELLWIEPSAARSEEVARFLLILYTWRHGIIELDPRTTPQEWKWVKTFIKPWHVLEDGEAWEVLSDLRTKYGFPDRWRGVLKYVGRVVRGLRPNNHGGEFQMDTEAALEQMERRRRGNPVRSRGPGRQDDTDLLSPAQVAAGLAKSRETVYRWVREGILAVSRSSNGRLRFGPSVVEEAQKRIEARGMRLALTRRLVAKGKNPEAAKKFNQRRLQSRKTPIEIAHELKEGRP